MAPPRSHLRSATLSPARMAKMGSAASSSTPSAPRREGRDAASRRDAPIISYLRDLRTPRSCAASHVGTRDSPGRTLSHRGAPGGSAKSWRTLSWNGEPAGGGFGIAEGVLVPAGFAIFVSLRALDRAFLERALVSMGDYRGILAGVFFVPLMQLVTAMFCVFYVVNKRLSEDDERYGLGWFSLRSKLASSHGPVPIRWMVFFAFFDQLYITMKFLPVRYYIPEAMRHAMQHTVVFWTACTAAALLGSRYTQLQIGAVVLGLLGCVIRVSTEIQMGTLSSPVSAFGEPTDVGTGTTSLMYMLYMFVCMQNAFSLCYKQKALKMFDMDIMWATFWSQNFQIIWGFLLYTLKWIPWPSPGDMVHHTPSCFGQQVSEAWTCFTGGDPTGTQHLIGGLHQCEEELPWVWFVMFLFCSFGFNLFVLWIVKYLSATWAASSMVVCSNCIDVVKQFKLFNPAKGGNHIMPLEAWLSLALSVMSIWLYSVEEELDADGAFVCGAPARHRAAADVERQSPEPAQESPELGASVVKDESYRRQWSPSMH